MNYKEDKERRKLLWLEKNSIKSQLLSNNILPMNPEVGFYISVGGLEISEDFFKEEYDQIVSAHYSVLKKMDMYFKNSEKRNQKSISYQSALKMLGIHNI